MVFGWSSISFFLAGMTKSSQPANPTDQTSRPIEQANQPQNTSLENKKHKKLLGLKGKPTTHASL